MSIVPVSEVEETKLQQNLAIGRKQMSKMRKKNVFMENLIP